MKSFRFRITTPEGIVYQSNSVVQVNVPTKAGEIGILAQHTPLLSLLRPGEISVMKEKGSSYDISMAVSEGFVEVRGNGDVIILADTAERAEHIDIKRAQEGRKRAEDLLKQKEHMAEEDFAKISAQIEKELARIRVGSRAGRK